MATRDELRVRLTADSTQYDVAMRRAQTSLQRFTGSSVKARQDMRAMGLQSAELAAKLVSVTGASSLASRGITGVAAAAGALALTPAGAAMTALSFAIGLVADSLLSAEPAVEETAESVETLAVVTEDATDRLADAAEQIEAMRLATAGLATETSALALSERERLTEQQEALERRARLEAEEVERIRELTGRFSDVATQELRVGEALEKYLGTEKELLEVTKRLGEIRQSEREERQREAAARAAAADRELASLVALAQRRVGAGVEAARKEEQEREAAIVRQVEALRAQIQTSEERLDIEQQIADSLLEQGRITEEEHERRTDQIHAQRQATIAFWSDFEKRVAEAKEESDRQAAALRDTVSQVQDATNSLLSSGVNEVFAQWTRDLEGAERVAAELLRTVVQIAQQQLVQRLGQAALSAGGGGQNWPRFAAGGLVHGPGTSTSDSVVARLSRGEFVMRAAAVERIGVGMLEAMNRMPRFANGGMVTEQQGGGGDVRVSIINVQSEEEALTAIASRRGERVLRNVLRRSGQ